MRFLAKLLAIIVSAMIGLVVGTYLAGLPFWPDFLREVLPGATGIAFAFATADLPVWKKD